MPPTPNPTSHPHTLPASALELHTPTGMWRHMALFTCCHKLPGALWDMPHQPHCNIVSLSAQEPLGLLIPFVRCAHAPPRPALGTRTHCLTATAEPDDMPYAVAFHISPEKDLPTGRCHCGDLCLPTTTCLPVAYHGTWTCCTPNSWPSLPSKHTHGHLILDPSYRVWTPSGVQ